MREAFDLAGGPKPAAVKSSVCRLDIKIVRRRDAFVCGNLAHLVFVVKPFLTNSARWYYLESGTWILTNRYAVATCFGTEKKSKLKGEELKTTNDGSNNNNNNNNNKNNVVLRGCRDLSGSGKLDNSQFLQKLPLLSSHGPPPPNSGVMPHSSGICCTVLDVFECSRPGHTG